MALEEDVNDRMPSPAQTTTAARTAGKADLGKRFVAILIDFVIVYLIGFIPFGGTIGILYILLRDGLPFDSSGCSLGKKIMKLRPVRLDGKPMDLETSFKRNWTLVFGSVVQVLIFIPIIGWALIPFVAVAAVILYILEVVLVFLDPQGRRLGDRMAGTKVVEVGE
jgi:uncharacterized RDD family membrane protein YckC